MLVVLLLGLGAAVDANAVAAEGLSLLQLEARTSKVRAHGNSFVDVVGERGTYVISSDASPRAAHTKAALLSAGIASVTMPSTDASLALPQELAEACIPSRRLARSVGIINASNSEISICHGLTKRPGGKFGSGCQTATEQAIASSHRNALLRAKGRTPNAPPWTAIMEDDVVPVDPLTWNDNFRSVWKHVPSTAKVVRLGWCNLMGGTGIDEYAKHNETEFVVVEDMILAGGRSKGKYYTGGCTTAYMVHREAIDEVLSIFPCCCPLDCCLERELFYWPHPRCRSGGSKECWGQQHLVSIDAKHASAFSEGFTTFRQKGILVQDNRFTKSSRSRTTLDDFPLVREDQSDVRESDSDDLEESWDADFNGMAQWS